MVVTYGVPVWTTGGFSYASGLDDLGLEGVGAGMLRRLLPGVIQTTPNAGYYAFYPYLLARWEDMGHSFASVDFKPWYRRQEVAFVAGCALHDHRGRLGGVAGIGAVGHAVRDAVDDVRLDRLAAEQSSGYLKAAYGGFGMYYRAVLRDLRLTVEGKGTRVDRVTEIGRVMAEAFAERFEDTTYFREFSDVDAVPLEVLAELGQKVCLCSIPDRVDHQPLLDAFFDSSIDNPRWASRRLTRVKSFGLFLEFHSQRPETVSGNLGSWRRAITAHRFSDGTPWDTAFPKVRQSWRAYQIREAETIALLGLWVSFLMHLSAVEPAPRRTVRDYLVDMCDWESVGVAATTPLADALAVMEESLPTNEDLIAAATSLRRPQHSEAGEYVIVCLRVLAGCLREARSHAEGFDELVDEGGPGKWSLKYLGQWMAERATVSIAETLADLIEAMTFQHQGVALGKLNITDRRDPFCVTEDDGLMSVVRMDEPSWTGARFDTVNHLLWTLGLLDGPEGASRLTDLGTDIYTTARDNA